MFQKLGRFEVAIVAAVLIALLTTVGGLAPDFVLRALVISQATVYSDVVRFAVQNNKVAVLRAEVFDLGGKRLFDSGPTMGISGQQPAFS